MPLLCPVCLEDRDGPPSLPGCRGKHTGYAPPPQAAPPPPRRVDGAGVGYASTCVVPVEWTPYVLESVEQHNHDTAIFRFALPERGQRLGLPVCGCLLMRAKDCEHGGGDAVRPYTPISPSTMTGAFEVMLKLYKEWGSPKHPHSYCPPGAVSNHVFGLKPGDSVEFKHIAANVKIPYYHDDGSPPGFKGVERVTMIAVGVGIAPMVQVLHEMLDNNPSDTTEVVLLYGNRTVGDILLRDLLGRWEREHPHRFRVVHHVGSRYSNVFMHFDDCPKSCGKPCKRRKVPDPERFDELPADRRERGWVCEETILRHGFPADDPKHVVFVCGLPNVYRTLCGDRAARGLAAGTALSNLGFPSDRVVKF